MVIYKDIFQYVKVFVRGYDGISYYLTKKRKEYNWEIKVHQLTKEEVKSIDSDLLR